MTPLERFAYNCQQAAKRIVNIWSDAIESVTPKRRTKTACQNIRETFLSFGMPVPEMSDEELITRLQQATIAFAQAGFRVQDVTVPRLSAEGREGDV